MKAVSTVIVSAIFLLSVAAAQTSGGAAGTANVTAQQSTSHHEGAQAEGNTSGSAQAGVSAAGGSSQADVSASGQTANSANSAIPAGMTIPAVLAKSVDAKKAKQGDVVEAKTNSKLEGNGGMALPKGTKLIGHVTEAKAREKGESQSVLGIMFDKAVLKDGQEIPFHAIIQAASAVQQAASISSDDTMMSSRPSAGAAGASGEYGGSRGGMVGEVGNTVGAAAGTVGSAAGNVGATAGSTVGAVGQTTASTGSRVGGSLGAAATGVSGIPGVAISPQLSNAANGSVFVSDTRNVKLDSGTQLVLRTIPQ